MIDRFEILHFSQLQRRRAGDPATHGLIRGDEILAQVSEARAWMRERGRNNTPNSRRPIAELEGEWDSFFFEHMMNRDLGSHRRYQATLRVARSFADLERVENVQGRHFDMALNITWKPFEKLKRWD